MTSYIEDVASFCMWSRAIYEIFLQACCILLEGKNVVREHNDLVTAALVKLQEKLTSLKLVRIHSIVKLPAIAKQQLGHVDGQSPGNQINQLRRCLHLLRQTDHLRKPRSHLFEEPCSLTYSAMKSFGM